MTRTYLAVAVVGFLAACGTPAKTDCNDGLDNDGDGVVDSGDSGCAFNGGRLEAPNAPQCSDGIDNDGDGVVDQGQDPGCDANDDDQEKDPVRACNDLKDNDDDGLSDDDDPGCETPIDDDEQNLPSCANGIDDDQDGKVDYPNDPGCQSGVDPTETDPSVLPQCSDGQDNDGDGAGDYPTDAGCSSAIDNEEFNHIFGECGDKVPMVDLTQNKSASERIEMPGTSNLLGACGGQGAEFAYTYTVTAPDRALVVSTDDPNTTLDTVVYVRTTCQDATTELACDDDGGTATQRGSHLLLDQAPPGEYVIVVDRQGPSSTGDFTVTIGEMTGRGGACDAAAATAECAPGLVCRAFSEGAPTTCEFPVCSDGVDADADGKIDYPADPGCATTADADETDPNPLPACANGADDDSDGATDWPMDEGCTAASDTSEIHECVPGVAATAFELGTSVTGTTVGGTSQFTSNSCGGTGPEKIFLLHTDWPLLSLTLRLVEPTTSYDAVLHVRAGECGNTTAQVACNDSSGVTGVESQVTFAPTAGEDYYIFVDTWSSGGNFLLEASGVLAAGAVCDPALASFTCEPGYICGEGATASGDWSCRRGACFDGVDSDADGKTDYPNDPGCVDEVDDDETDPATAPVCSNGMDDDLDTFSDYPADPGCASAADGNEIDDCVTGVPVNEHPGGVVTGNTSAKTKGVAAPLACDASGGTAQAFEEVYSFDLARAATSLTVSSVGSAFDTVVYVREGACDVAGPDIWCNDNGGAASTSVVTMVNPAVGTYYVVVDGKYSTAFGAYTLAITGKVGEGEACSASDTVFTCDVGLTCGASGTCEATPCNDGLDNDGDGKADDMDPGCASADDTDETNSGPLPQCGDGTDNDADTLVDFPVDLGCTRASDAIEQDCSDADFVDVTHSGGTYSGTTAGKGNQTSAPCGIGTSTAPDVVHALTVPGVTTVTLDACTSDYDTTLYVMTECGSAATLACSEDSCGVQSIISNLVLQPGTYYIAVDGYSSQSGAYTLDISGTVGAGERCDPLQVVAGFFSCSAGTSCVSTATGHRCQ